MTHIFEFDTRQQARDYINNFNHKNTAGVAVSLKIIDKGIRYQWSNMIETRVSTNSKSIKVLGAVPLKRWAVEVSQIQHLKTDRVIAYTFTTRREARFFTNFCNSAAKSNKKFSILDLGIGEWQRWAVEQETTHQEKKHILSKIKSFFKGNK